MLALSKILPLLIREVISCSNGDTDQKHLRCFLFSGLAITRIAINTTAEQCQAFNDSKHTFQSPIKIISR